MKEQYDDMRQLIEKYLRDDASPYEISYIESWIKHDERLNRWFISCIENSESEMPAEKPAFPSAEHLPKTAGHRQGIVAAVAAACVIILFAIGGAYILGDRHDENIFQNPLIIGTLAGERSRVVLPDGSSVTLNHLSELQYHYDKKKKQRVLSLHGEAAFDIRTDPEHPFVVKCDGLELECRGTSFNVKGYPDENVITVVLCNGAVTARSLRQRFDMKPGDKINFDKHLCNLESTSVEPSDYTGWTSGTSRFNDDRLDDILRMLSRHYGISINLLTPSLRDVRLSGSIGRKNLKETLDLISTAAGAQYEFETDTTVCIYKHADNINNKQ